MIATEFVKVFGVTLGVFGLTQFVSTNIMRKIQWLPISTLVSSYSPSFVGLSFLVVTVNLDVVCLINTDLIPYSSVLRQGAFSTASVGNWIGLSTLVHLIALIALYKGGELCLSKEIEDKETCFYKYQDLFSRTERLGEGERAEVKYQVWTTQSFWRRVVIDTVGILLFSVTTVLYFGG